MITILFGILMYIAGEFGLARKTYSAIKKYFDEDLTHKG